jgi:hypothetical protein
MLARSAGQLSREVRRHDTPIRWRDRALNVASLSAAVSFPNTYVDS